MAILKKLQELDFRRVFIVTIEKEKEETETDFAKVCKALWKDLAHDHSYASAATIGTFPDKNTFSFTISIPIKKEFDMFDDINKKAEKHRIKTKRRVKWKK